MFFNENILIYPWQLDLHILVILTNGIRKKLHKGNIVCGIFIYLQKPFDTFEHEILLAKLENYGIHGLANSRFKSYFLNRKQFVSINGHKKYDIPEDSDLDPRLVLIYIKDVNNAVKYCNVHHFGDDTN